MNSKEWADIHKPSNYQPSGPWWHKALFVAGAAGCIIAANHALMAGIVTIDVIAVIAGVATYFTPDYYSPM